MPLLDMTLARGGKICFWTSSVGRKLQMAITGLALVGFVTVHAIGNLTAYLGAGAMNAYAAFLKGMAHGVGIWVFRGFLSAVFLVHAWTAISLTLDNWAARPHGYRQQRIQAATWASRYMRYTGTTLAIFVVYHLLHLTLGWNVVHPDFNPDGVVDVYRNFTTGFKDPIASGFYIIGNLCLGMHVWHGIWSFTQTLGWAHPGYDTLRRRVALVWSLALVGVNISYPIAVLTGILR